MNGTHQPHRVPIIRHGLDVNQPSASTWRGPTAPPGNRKCLRLGSQEYKVLTGTVAVVGRHADVLSSHRGDCATARRHSGQEPHSTLGVRTWHPRIFRRHRIRVSFGRARRAAFGRQRTQVWPTESRPYRKRWQKVCVGTEAHCRHASQSALPLQSLQTTHSLSYR